MENKEDKELNAMRNIINALSSLDVVQRKRVIDYVVKRLEIKSYNSNVGLDLSEGAANKKGLVDSERGLQQEEITNIRTLKEKKSPKSAIQMAVLVAYYLSRLAPDDEKRDTIGASEIDKYFEQAKFKSPRNSKVLLVDTKRAGYFESVGRGQYKLNPVGLNLAAYNMPTSSKMKKAKKKSSKSQKTKKRGSKISKNSSASKKRS